jgi:hypothetical protein
LPLLSCTCNDCCQYAWAPTCRPATTMASPAANVTIGLLGSAVLACCCPHLGAGTMAIVKCTSWQSRRRGYGASPSRSGGRWALVRPSGWRPYDPRVHHRFQRACKSPAAIGRGAGEGSTTVPQGISVVRCHRLRVGVTPNIQVHHVLV